METEKKIIHKKTGEEVYNYKIYNKTWYNKHNEKYRQKTKCEHCGGSYSKANYSNHIKTKKHLNGFTQDINETNVETKVEIPIKSLDNLDVYLKDMKKHIEGILAYKSVLEKNI